LKFFLSSETGPEGATAPSLLLVHPMVLQ